MSDYLVAPSSRIERLSFSESPVVRSPPIPIPARKQKIRRSASFSVARLRDSGFVGSSGGTDLSCEEEKVKAHPQNRHGVESCEKRTTPIRNRRATAIPSVVLTPVSPDDFSLSAHGPRADSPLHDLWLPLRDIEDEDDGVFILPPSPLSTPTESFPSLSSFSAGSPRCRLRRAAVVRLPSEQSQSECDDDDEEKMTSLTVPVSLNSRPSSPSIPIPIGQTNDGRMDEGGRGEGGRVGHGELGSRRGIAIPNRRRATNSFEGQCDDDSQMHESLQYHIALSCQDESFLADKRTMTMFAPSFSPRHSCNSSPWRHRSSHLAGSPSPWRNRSSHLAGSPSPWRHSFDSPSNQTSNDKPSDDGLSLRISFPSDGKSRVSTRYRHPSLDGDNSIGDDFYRSLDGSSLVEPLAQVRAAAAAVAAEDPLVRRPSVYENEELGAVGGAVGGVGREETGAGRLHAEVPRGAPLPRPSQSERHLPDIVPRNDRRISAPARFDSNHPMARQIGVELCRIADEIEAQYLDDEGAVGERVHEGSVPDLLEGSGEIPTNSLRHSSSAPVAMPRARLGSSIARRFSNLNLTARSFNN